MTFEEKEVHILTELGFTENQIKLYLTLLKVGEANGKTLAKQARVPRTIVYRVLDELQNKGLVEKEITQPYTFRAVAIQYGMKMLITQRVEELNKIRIETKEVLRRTNKNRQKSLKVQDYRFVMIDRKERIIQRIRQLHDNAKVSVDILTTLQRLLQILQDSFHNHQEALKRGTQYRVVLDSFYQKVRPQENIATLLSNSNFSLRLNSSSLCVNAAIFDGKEAIFCFYPSKPVQDSPVIWTNHPSFLAMYKNYFEDVWKSAHVYASNSKNYDKLLTKTQAN